MKIRNAIAKLLTATLALAAMAVFGANGTAGQAVYQLSSYSCSFPAIGFVPGQTLRISVFNPNTTEQQNARISGHVKIFDGTGNVLAQSEEVVLPPGQFRSFDFNRDDLRLAGEPGTGRLQVGASINVVLGDGSVRILPESFPAALELVDNRTGETRGVYHTGSVGWVKLSPDA